MQNRQDISHTLSSDLKFLIACCKTELNDEDTQFILSYPSTTNHQLLTAMALCHGILPLVYKTIKNLNTSSPSDDQSTSNHQLSTLVNELKAHYQTIAQRNMLMSAELIRILQLLEKNSIEALAFKGPALSQMAYGDITLRQYVDLDVLVKKEDIYRVDNLLKELGYQRVIKLTENQERLWLILKHDMGLYHPKNGIHFEMHWSLLDEDYPIQMDQHALWENPQLININGKEIKTFPNEELLLYLCIHGSTHLWERIEWIKDIDLLIRTQTIDWEKIAKKAERGNVETIFYLGVYLAYTLFSTQLPSTVSVRIAHNKKLPVLTDYITKSWNEDNLGGISGTLQRTLAMLRLFPDTKARLSYLHKILLKPTLNEYDYIDLPKGMYWAYYFIRPYLLLKKYLSNS